MNMKMKVWQIETVIDSWLKIKIILCNPWVQLQMRRRKMKSGNLYYNLKEKCGLYASEVLISFRLLL